MSESDLWFLHASMGNASLRNGLGDDRVLFSELGLTHNASRAEVLDAVIRIGRMNRRGKIGRE